MKKGKLSLRFIWALFMAFAYVGISYLVLFTPYILPYNSDTPSGNDKNLIIRLIFGIIMFFYGIMRGYRIWKGMGIMNQRVGDKNRE